MRDLGYQGIVGFTHGFHNRLKIFAQESTVELGWHEEALFTATAELRILPSLWLFSLLRA